LRDVFEAPTIRGLCDKIDAQLGVAKAPAMAELADDREEFLL